jgi:hypothetical protein
LQLLKDRLVDELSHLLEGVQSQKHIDSLQERIQILEKLHHFPLIINRVATLESIAAECEEAKLLARTMRQDLDEKTATLSKRGIHTSSLQAEIEALKKKLQQNQYLLNKEISKREEVESKASDTISANENSIKELRKQVRYHQLRVQELLKRVASSRTNNINDTSLLTNENNIDQQQQHEIRKQHVDPQIKHHHHSPTASEQQKENTLPSTTLSAPKAATTKRTSTPTTTTTTEKRKPTSTTIKTVTIVEEPTTTKSKTTSSPQRNVKLKQTTTTTQQQPQQSSSPPPPVAAVVHSSPEKFGVIEDPMQLARNRFSEIVGTKQQQQQQQKPSSGGGGRTGLVGKVGLVKK